MGPDVAFDLGGKVVVITGIGGGMGREAALRFAGAGAFVVGCDIDARACAKTVSLVRDQGGAIEATAGVDLGDPEQTREWIESAGNRHGHIDVLYNNASAARFGRLHELSVDDWRFTMRNELDLVFFASRYAWPYLARRGGVIINVASIAAWHGSREVGLGPHSAAKAAVVALTRQLSLEGAASGIRAVSISPGFIRTLGTEDALRDENIRNAIVKSVPLARPGEPAEIVSVALFMASSGASFITGTDIVVDGGRLSA